MISAYDNRFHGRSRLERTLSCLLNTLPSLGRECPEQARERSERGSSGQATSGTVAASGFGGLDVRMETTFPGPSGRPLRARLVLSCCRTEAGLCCIRNGIAM